MHFERMLDVLLKRRGHYLARLVEKAKIDLTDRHSSLLCTQEIEPEIIKEIHRTEFERSIEELIRDIAQTISLTIEDAGISPQEIDAIFMTGGSSLIPAVREQIFSIMPNARLIEGDKFGSVALGLTLSAREKFA